MRGAHHRHLEALGELGMLIGIDQLVSELGRVVRESFVEFARSRILAALEEAVQLERLLQALDHVYRLARKAVNLLAREIEPRVMERRNIVDSDQQPDERNRVEGGVRAVTRRASGRDRCKLGSARRDPQDDREDAAGQVDPYEQPKAARNKIVNQPEREQNQAENSVKRRRSPHPPPTLPPPRRLDRSLGQEQGYEDETQEINDVARVDDTGDHLREVVGQRQIA